MALCATSCCGWYEGDENNPAGWLCDGCRQRALSLRYGPRSPEARAAYDSYEAPNLKRVDIQPKVRMSTLTARHCPNNAG